MDYTLPFGRHKGTRVTDLPLSYLGWLRDLDDFREPLRSVVDHEWARRFPPPPPPPRTGPLTLRPPHPDVLRDVVRAGLRALARQHLRTWEGTRRRCRR
jgi:hypothetical protein